MVPTSARRCITGGIFIQSSSHPYIFRLDLPTPSCARAFTTEETYSNVFSNVYYPRRGAHPCARGLTEDVHKHLIILIFFAPICPPLRTCCHNTRDKFKHLFIRLLSAPRGAHPCACGLTEDVFKHLVILILFASCCLPTIHLASGVKMQTLSTR
jgi:hypothetical protein